MNSLPSVTAPVLRTSRRMYNFTTAVPKKLRSVQKIKAINRKENTGFPVAKSFISQTEKLGNAGKGSYGDDKSICNCWFQK